ncbi:SixA phosphatase family protein [Penaeicola halotolerans]|uniref:SixA phosphatase family protein n=1 Tax=Penaeicola halotolerans TaxID=2793196 RepID=UPI001CF8DF54|nr:histidine phosphatase family protein [Penaeicola halotolerans]
MVKYLIVLRHGEAHSFLHQTSDFQRELTELGKQQIKSAANFIKEKELIPDVILASAATRTRQSAAIAFLEMECNKTALYLKQELYSTSMEQIIEILSDQNSTIEKLMVVGHNPELSMLLTHLSGDGYITMDTGQVFILKTEIEEWYHLSADTCTIVFQHHLN